jgi:hypothetical protein
VATRLSGRNVPAELPLLTLHTACPSLLSARDQERQRRLRRSPPDRSLLPRHRHPLVSPKSTGLFREPPNRRLAPLPATRASTHNELMALLRDKHATERPGKRPTSRSPFLLVLVLVLVVVAATTVAGLFVVLAFGQVHGVEFSPQSFQRRSYTFFQIPLIRWQVTPVWRDDQTQELEQHLGRQRLLPNRLAPSRWDIVWVTESSRRREGDPAILTRYLEVTDSQRNQRWLTWTIEHPERAKALWPAVQLAAELNAYVLIPPLFDMAVASVDDAEGFTQQIGDFLDRGLIELADVQELDSARRLYKAVLERPTLDAELRRHAKDCQARLDRKSSST